MRTIWVAIVITIMTAITRTLQKQSVNDLIFDCYVSFKNHDNLTENPNENHIGNHNENPPIYKEVKKEEDISCENSTNLPPDLFLHIL